MLWVMEALIYLSGLFLGLAMPFIMVKEGVSKKYCVLLMVLFTLLMYLSASALSTFTTVNMSVDVSKTPLLGFITLFLAGGGVTSFLVNRK